MDRSLLTVLLLLGTLGLFQSCHGNRELLKVAYGNIKRESMGAATTVESGTIPSWLDGTFIRHSCGAYGEVDSVGSGLQEQGVYNYIDHLFDCFNTGTNFKLQDGAATFTNRYFPSAIKKVYDEFDNKMNDSRVFHRGVLGHFDYNREGQLAPNVSAYVSNLVPDRFPQVSFWQIGNRVTARGEGVGGQWINAHTAEGLGEFPFAGDDIFEGQFTPVNPAHEQYDENGDLWSMTMSFTVAQTVVIEGEWVIYKVTADRVRTVMARHHIGSANLTLCWGTVPFPDLSQRLGYIHAFGMTDDYVIIPMSSWLVDPCAVAVHGTYPQKPVWRGIFNWYEDHPSSLIVIRKSDGQHMGTVKTTSFFVTHMVNSYQEGPLIYMDMLVYKNSSIYEDNFVLDNLFKEDWAECTVERMTINTSDWTVTRRSLRQRGADKMEMSNVNPLYVTKPYTYAYFIVNPFITGGKIVKLNVRTGAEVDYVLPYGQLPHEPKFVPRPGATAEDDGILLIQGTDVVNEIAFLDIVDARTMTLEAHVLAPELALPGLHNNYYPCSVGGSSDDDTSACKVTTTTTTLPTTPSSAVVHNSLQWTVLLTIVTIILYQ